MARLKNKHLTPLIAPIWLKNENEFIIQTTRRLYMFFD